MQMDKNTRLRKLQLMQKQIPVFRIFVSSTFSDMEKERDALQSVYTSLQAYCQNKGARFQAIDLRWGISEEAGFDQLTLQICLDELRRCQRLSPRPNFIVLLGDRYGSRPLPACLNVEEHKEICRRSPEPNIAELLDRFYQLDKNCVPPKWVLSPRKEMLGDTWRGDEKRLKAAIVPVAMKMHAASVQLHRYVRSYTHHEIEHGVFQPSDAPEHVFCYLRSIEGFPKDKAAGNYIDLDADDKFDEEAWTRQQALKHELKAALSVGGDGARKVFECKTQWQNGALELPLEELRRRVEEHLKSVIDRELERSCKRAATSDPEIEAHRTFAAGRASHFVGRQDVLSRITSYLRDDSDVPLVICGRSGQGKSALMAKAAERTGATEARLVSRFIGATPASTIVPDLLSSICRELDANVAQSDSDDDKDVFRLSQKLRELLKRDKSNRRSVLFIDGLDQLVGSGESPQLGWLPWRLPEDAKLVLSVVGLGDQAAASLRHSLERFIPEDHFVELDPLDREDGRRLLKAWFGEVENPGFGRASGAAQERIDDARQLTEEQQTHVLDAFVASGGSPLFLKLAFEEVRHWRSFDGLPEKTGGRRGIANSTAGLIEDLLSRLTARRSHGPVITRTALGLLAVARHGLAEDEIVDLLSADLSVMEDFHSHSQTEYLKPVEKRLKKLPPLLWSRLFADLEPYLLYRNADGTIVIDFYHRQLRDAVVTNFVDDDACRKYHKDLARYFKQQRHRLGRHGTLLPSQRKLAELPFHLVEGAALPAELTKTLCDLRFVEAKCRAGLYFDLLRDCQRVLAKQDIPPIACLNRALQVAKPEITLEPNTTLQSITNVLRWLDGGLPQFRRRIHAATGVLDGRGPWIAAEASPPTISNVVSASFEGHARVQAISADGRWLAAATNHDRVDIYDMNTGAPTDVRSLEGMNRSQPDALAIEEDSGRLAWTNETELAVESGGPRLAVRDQNDSVLWHPSGAILALGRDNSLVLWNPVDRTTTVLVSDLPKPLVSLDLSLDGRTALFVAGQSARQVVGVARQLAGQWLVSRVCYEGPRRQGARYEGAPAAHARLSDDGGRVLIAAVDRSLKLISLETGAVEREIFYEKRAQPVVRGAPLRCAMASQSRCYVATTEGHIAEWFPTEDRLERLESYGSKTVATPLVLFHARRTDERLVVSTPERAWIASAVSSPEGLRQQNAEVDDCCISPDGTIVSVSRQEGMVRWWNRRGLASLASHTFGRRERPRRVAVCEADGSVMVGYDEGCIIAMGTGLPAPREQDSWTLFKNPVAGIIAAHPSSVIAGDNTTRIVEFDLTAGKLVRLIRHEAGMKELRKLLDAKPYGLFWSLRRDQLQGGTYSVISLTEQSGDETVVGKWNEYVNDITVSPDGARLAVGGASVRLFEPARPLWIETFCRKSPADLLAFVDTGAWLAVVPSGSQWLEIWRVELGMPKVAAFRIGRQAHAMAIRGDWLVIGCRSGEILSLQVRGLQTKPDGQSHG